MLHALKSGRFYAICNTFLTIDVKNGAHLITVIAWRAIDMGIGVEPNGQRNQERLALPHMAEDELNA